MNTVQSISRGGCSESSSIYQSSEDVYDRFALSVGLEASYLNQFSFSASSSYSTMTKSLTTKDTFYSEASCSYTHVDAQLKPREALSLDQYAQNLVDMITEGLSDNTDEWSDQPQWRFIQMYGTHYFQRAALGGTYQMTYEIEKSFFSEHTKEDLDVAVSAQANWGTGSAGVSVDMAQESEEMLEQFSSQSDRTERYFGGSIDLQEQPEKGRNWQESTYRHPWVISGEVKPIYNLIKDENKRNLMEEAVKQYILHTYVNSAVELNVYDDTTIQNLVNELSGKTLREDEVAGLRNLLINSKQSLYCIIRALTCKVIKHNAEHQWNPPPSIYVFRYNDQLSCRSDIIS